MHIKVIIFDFNGVIIDDEPIHMGLIQDLVKPDGITITKEQYYDNYLAYDDLHCFQQIYKDAHKSLKSEQLNKLVAKKASQYEEAIKDRLILFPKAVEVVKSFYNLFPLAIASGALRSEIEIVLKKSGLLDCFSVIISADDTTCGKPHPEPYLLALEALNKTLEIPLKAEECLVIEDAINGIEAAQKAGMKCIAVAHSYHAEALKKADLVIKNIEELSPSLLSSHNDIT